MESFHSIQGEGAHVGKSAFFIRLASCKVGCEWCDTKESWNPKNHPIKSIFEIAKSTREAKQKGASFVVITGGEPLHHNLDSLCKAIREETSSLTTPYMPIHIETSGVDHISGKPNWITLSPKRHYPPKKEVLNKCQELKVVIHSREDLVFAEEMNKIIENYKKKANHNQLNQPFLFLQPGWESPEGNQLAIDYVLHHPNWRLSIQTHKWLGLL